MRTFLQTLKIAGVVLGLSVIVMAYLQSMRDDPEPVLLQTPEEPSISSIHQAEFREKR